MTLSTGMDGRAIAYSKLPVQYASGGQSTVNFHADPDGAGIFPADDGGFYYASNSETPPTEDGGVGVLKFDANGDVQGYYRTLTGTNNNCGGGRTPW